MTSSEIRAKFLEYFKERGHAVIASSSLIPKDDPTLLFTNSGWCNSRTASWPGGPRLLPGRKLPEVRARRRQAQRPGKRGLHGAAPHLLRDARNFSFGDYFKKESIAWGWTS